MSAGIEVLAPGIAVAVQDRGRRGWRRFGVPQAGALDPFLLAAANLLLGNDEDAASFEIPISGPTIIAKTESIGVALAGDFDARIRRSDGTTATVPSWRGFALNPGDQMRIGSPRRGIGYVALSGGVLTPLLLGSRSTYRRAAIGRFLEAGDMIPCGTLTECQASDAWMWDEAPIRVMAGPQQDHFSPDSLDLFCRSPFRVLPASDRMGLRLDGPPLRHSEKGPEIATDGVLPGAIQVPGDGQPIVLLADGQTTGGYAKIATVITADLPKLAHKRPGDEIVFQWIERDEAHAALLRLQAQFALWRGGIGRFQAGSIDEAALYRNNLISGATAGDNE